MKGYVDKRCPCVTCIIQTTCTNYCEWFHSYRKLLLAEVEFFISSCNVNYKIRTEPDGTRLVSSIQRDIDIAFLRVEDPTKLLKDHYFKTKKNFNFLDDRFRTVCENSRSTNRGITLK
jgi:hypothetical protein